MEVGSAAWYSKGKVHLVAKLESVQKKALRWATKVGPRASPLYIATDLRVEPLDLRLQKLTARYYVRTRANPLLPRVKAILNDKYNRVAITMRQCLLGPNDRVSRMADNRLTIEYQEPRFTSAATLQPPPNVLVGGCPHEDKDDEKKVDEYVRHSTEENCPHKSVDIFVDGSAVDNPGACGAGGVFMHRTDGKLIDEDVGEFTAPLSEFGNNDEAELFAIGKGAETVKANMKEEDQQDVRFTFFTDSRVAIHWITTPNTDLHSTIPWTLLNYTRSHLHSLCEMGTVRLLWIPGHRQVQHHDRADGLARAAATEVKEEDTKRYGVSLAALYTHIERTVMNSWNERLTNHVSESKDTSRGHFVLPKCYSTVPPKALVKRQWGGSYKGNLLRAKARMGTYGNEVQYIAHYTDVHTSLCSFAQCDELESVEHIIRNCSALADTQLHRLVQSTGYANDLSTWLGCNTQLTIDVNSQIIHRLEEFLLRRERLLQEQS